VWERGVRVLDITGDTPRAARTLRMDQLFGADDQPGPDYRQIYDAALSRDGRHLYLLGGRRVQVLDLTHAGRPTRGQTVAFPTDVAAFTMAVTPNGGALVLGGSTYGESRREMLAVYSLSDAAKPRLVRRAVLPSFGLVVNVVARNSSIYVGLMAEVEYDGYAAYKVVRVRHSDLTVIGREQETTFGQPDWAEHEREPYVEATSPAGNLVYLTYHNLVEDRWVGGPRQLAWTDLDLGTVHRIAGVGEVEALAVSPGGRTKGLLVVAARTSRGQRLELVKPQ
jgi:hypothetical protein